MITPGGKLLIGDWRRRMGTKTDAHLYRWVHGKPSQQPIGPDHRYPICGKRVPLGHTTTVATGRPCTDCLVAAITERNRQGVALDDLGGA